MYKTFEIRGGAKIGKSNASSPLVSLYVDQNVLRLNAVLIGNLIFLPEDIVELEVSEGFFSNKGIRIRHTVQKYSPDVIFYCNKNVDEVIAAIRETGFLDKNRKRPSFDVQVVRKQQDQGSIPFKKSFLVFLLVTWNALLILNFYFFITQDQDPKALFGVWSKVLFGLLILLAVLTLTSERFRELILKEGRKLEDVKWAAVLALCFSLIMLGSTFFFSHFAK